MPLRKLLTKITLRYFFKRNKFFAPLIVFGWAISFARWLIKKEKKSDSSIERLERRNSFRFAFRSRRLTRR